MSPKETAEAFSTGRFNQTDPHLSERVEWMVVGDRKLVAKEAVERHCE